MDRKELLDRCYEVYPDHPILKLRACEAVLKKGVEKEEEALLLEDTLSQLKLNPVFEKKLLHQNITVKRLFPRKKKSGALS